MSKIINIALITQLFIFNAISMNHNLNNLPNEMIATICDFYLGKFPNTRKEFNQKYKKFLNLRLVNKKFRDSIDKYCKHDEIWNQFDDYLFKIVKDKSLNIKDELFQAVQTGSKKYFEQLPDNNLKLFTNNNHKETNEFIKLILNSIEKRYSKNIGKIIIQKIITNDDVKNDINNDGSKSLNNYYTIEQIGKIKEIIESSNNDKKFKDTIIKLYNTRFINTILFMPVIYLLIVGITDIVISLVFNKQIMSNKNKILITVICTIIIYTYMFFNHAKIKFTNKERLIIYSLPIILYFTAHFTIGDLFKDDELKKLIGK